jgi:hypothetical protein
MHWNFKADLFRRLQYYRKLVHQGDNARVQTFDLTGALNKKRFISFLSPEQNLPVLSPLSLRAASCLPWWLPALRNSSRPSVAKVVEAMAVSAPHPAGLSLPSGYLSALH